MVSTGPQRGSFGMLLKTFRKRRGLTQQQLAERIGVPRRVIGKWEQEGFLPESKTLVLELARQLHLDDQEARQFLEVSLIALPPYFLIPLPRNPFFTGREEIQEALHTLLGVEQTIALIQSSALHGLGGVGKTQIALEYAYRYALEYSAVFWIAAETEEQIVSGLVRVAEILRLPERGDKDQQRVIVAVQRWLASHGQWLLIWDNVEDLRMLERFLSSSRSGAMLITTRLRAMGTFARGMGLEPMEQGEGVLFLLRRARMMEPGATIEQVLQFAEHRPAEYAAAVELVGGMGGLPLALDQAGAYLEATQCGLPAYLELFQTRRAALLQQRGEGACDHPASVATTFMLAITATTRRHPAVQDLLCVCSLLQPDAIPEELFLQGARHLGITLELVCCDVLEWDGVIAAARAYSLLSRQQEERTFSLHRLVQAVVVDAMTTAEYELWNRRVIEALEQMFPDEEYATWKQGTRLLPHALLCLHRNGIFERTPAFASLAFKTGKYLLELGKYTEAEPLFQRALQLREQMLGPGHLDVVHVLNRLGILYWKQGRYSDAEPFYQRALALKEQALGAADPGVALVINNLAIIYMEQGRYAEAESFYRQALAIREQALGLTDPGIALVVNNLAELYMEQGRYEEAEPLYRRALSLWEQILSPDHPHMALPLNNLAKLSVKQGRDEEAEQLYRRALQLQEQTWGPDHPDVAESLNNLANLLLMHRRDEQAETYFQRALTIREQHLGQYHPVTAETLHDLALFRQRQGKQSEALLLAERTLHIRSRMLGEVHPRTLATRMLYTQLLQE